MVSRSDTPMDAAKKAFDFLKRVQAPNGCWIGPCGAQHYLAPIYIIALYAIGKTVEPEEAVEMIRFMLLTASSADGGWGL